MNCLPCTVPGQHCFSASAWLLWCLCAQVIYKVFDEADLKPLLDAVNEETQKEKASEA